MKNNKQDNRIALANGDIINQYNSTGALIRQYIICKEVKRGGFSIAYDVCAYENEHKTATHYILKEFYPLQLCDIITRLDKNLIINENYSEEFKKDLEKFFNEKALQDTILPPSNTAEGSCFFYSTDAFVANGTGYIVSLTEDSKSFNDYFSEREIFPLNEMLELLKDVCQGLSVLHSNNALHLDISDNNILISNGKAKIIDFGNAIPLYGPDETSNIKINSYTAEFAPIELIELIQSDTNDIIPDTTFDTYSVCAIIFKYLTGESYKSGVHSNDFSWVNNLYKQKRLKRYGKKSLKLLKNLLIKGLINSPKKRYQSAQELYNALDDIQKVIESHYDMSMIKTFLIIISIAASFFGVFFHLIYVFSEAPPIQVTQNIGSTYSSEDEITFSLKVFDNDTNTGFYSTKQSEDAVILDGFDASVNVTIEQSPNNNYVLFNYTLSNLKSTSEGVKTITIGKIYSREIKGNMRKANKPLTQTFNYFEENIDILISEPSFKKINGNKHFCVDYNITVNSPEEYTGDISNVLLTNFTSENIEIEKTGENSYQISFYQISGNAGEAWFSIYEGTFNDEAGRSNKITKSPSFTIVDDEISNMPIQITTTVSDIQLEQGGYVVIPYNVVYSSLYKCSGVVSFLNCSGKAEVYSDKIVITDLSFEEGVDINHLGIRLDAGFVESLENGSLSEPISCYFLSSETVKDSTEPTVNTTYPTVNFSNDDTNPTMITFTIYVNDDTMISKVNNISSYIECYGFKYNKISVIECEEKSVYKVIYTEIKEWNNNEQPHLLIKAGLAQDTSGNISRGFKVPIKK